MGRGIRNRVRGAALKRVTVNPITERVSSTATPQLAQVGDGGQAKQVRDPPVFQHATAADAHETNVTPSCSPKVSLSDPLMWDLDMSSDTSDKNVTSFENKLHWTEKEKETHDNSSAEMEKVQAGNYTHQEGNFETKIENVEDAKDENVELESMSFSQYGQEEMPQTRLADSSKKKRKIKNFEEISKAIKDAAQILAVEIKDSFARLSGAICQEMAEKQKGLNAELMRTTALTMMERHKATRLITHDNASVNIFFSLPDEEKEEWVRALLNGSI